MNTQLKLHPIDFEYNHEGDKFLNLVCVAVDNKTFWLRNGEELEEFRAYMKSLEGEILVSHCSSLAEIPCCIEAGLDVDKYVWFDTFTTEKRLRSFIGKPDGAFSLLEVLKEYGLSHSYNETEKQDLRNIILTGEYLDYRRMEVLDYCSEDIKDLKLLAEKQIEKLEHQLSMDWLLDVATLKEVKYKEVMVFQFIRQQSITNITTAKMYYEPFQADYNKIAKMSDPRLVMLLKQNLNAIIPGVYDELGKQKNNVVRDFILKEDSGAYDWFKNKGYLTPSKDEISLKDEYLGEYLSEHKGFSDKLDTFRQVIKVIKACSGFQKEGEGNWITPNKFSDGLHCNASEFGTVTTRYTPKPSKGWIPGMGKALRNLLKPVTDDEVYFSLDFNAQEIWVIGQLSKDIKLLETYASNDIYMSVAQNMGLYPKDLKIPTEPERSEAWFKPYKPLRQKIKGMVLGLNYGMSPRTLAERCKMDYAEAEELVSQYNSTYSDKFVWTSTLISYFKNKASLYVGHDVCIKHQDYREGRARNERQAMNYPVQCLGATITREALRLAFERGIKPIFPVHDEIYFKTTKDRLEKDVATARACMIDAAFNAVGATALKQFPIKVGEVEVTTLTKSPVHSGGEATAELIERNLLLLKTLPLDYCPFTIKKQSKRKEKKEVIENTMEDFFE